MRLFWNGYQMYQYIMLRGRQAYAGVTLLATTLSVGPPTQ
jgi:hypothetical protein